MTTVPEQPDRTPTSELPDPGLADQLRAAERELVRRRIEAARHRADLNAAKRAVHRLRGHRRASRLRALRHTAMRTARIATRAALTVYGVIAFIDAVTLFLHGRPSTEMFIAAAGALGAAAVISSD